MTKRVKIRDIEFDLEDKDAALILIIQDLINAIGRIKNGG